MNSQTTTLPYEEDYRTVCFRLGFFLTITMLLREAAWALLQVIMPPLNDWLMRPENIAATASGTVPGAELLYAVQLTVSMIFLQLLPAVLSVFLLRYDREKIKAGYKKPQKNAKALTNFPACYGLGMTVNLATLGITQLISGSGSYNEAFNPVSAYEPPGFGSALVMFFFAAVLAPIFEEFIFRGAVLSALKPYGSGVAIFTSALMFGVMHGNFSQFFYATALGIVFGYIAVVTDSIFTTTIMHALFNGISSTLMLFICSDSIKKYYGVKEGVPDGDAFVITMFAVFMLAVIITALLGFGLMIGKIVKIKRYFLPQVWNGLTTWGKIRRLLFTPFMIIGLLLAADVFCGYYALNETGITQWLQGLSGV